MSFTILIISVINVIYNITITTTFFFFYILKFILKLNL